MSDLTGDRDPFEEVAESFLARFRAGQRPSVEEYAARHPELADQIRELLPALVMVEQDLTIDRDSDPPGRAAPAAASAFEEWRLGDYLILREIGRGGMGVVYEADQISLGRRVALKVLPNHLAGDGTALERFRREAKAAARLHHTNIVPVFEVGQDGDVAYYAMQFIRGQGLDQIVEELRRVRDPAREVNGPDHERSNEHKGSLAVARSRVGAPSNRQGSALAQTTGMLLTGRLAALGTDDSGPSEEAASGPARTERFHAATTSDLRPDGLSRELPPTSAGPGPSPSAVLPGGKHVSDVDTSGRRQPYFRSVAQIGRQAAQGLAYAHARGVVHRDIKPSNLLLDTEGVVWITDFGLAKADDDGLTASGDILGTLRYMAPERFRGEGDARADIYALGLTLYELLTLRPAYDTTDRLRLIETIKNVDPVQPRLIDFQIPRDLQTIVLKAIDKHPNHRYPTAEAMSEDLRRFLADEPIKARQISTSERYWRWARRNPAVATLGGVLTALLVIATVASLLTAAHLSEVADQNKLMAESERSARQEARRQAEAEASARATADRARTHAEKAEQVATEERNRADHEAEVAQQNLYYAQMHLSLQAWREHRGLPHMRELLAGWLPEEDSPDRRGWEWFYLNSLPYQNLRTLTEGVKGNHASAVAWHISSRRLAEGTSEGSIRIWDVDRERTTMILRGPAPMASFWGTRWLAWSPDGGTLAAGGGDGSVHLWETASGRELDVLRGHKSPVRSVAFSRDGARLAAWGSDGAIKIWDATSGQLVAEVTHPGGVNTGEWSPDSTRLAAGHEDGRVTISGGRAGDKLVTIRGPGDPIYCLAWSPDGTRLASTSANDFAVRIWDVATKKIVLEPLRHSHGITSIAWEPDGRRLATGSIDNAVKIWDATTGREALTLRGHVDRITSLSWGPEGRLASGGGDGSLRVWSSVSDQESSILPGHALRATSVSWDPNGKRLASAGDDGVVGVWDASSREQIATFRGHNKGRAHPQFGLIRSLAWSPDGTKLASAGTDGTARVWDVAGGREVFALPDDSGAVWSVAWSPDGTHLAAGSEDGTIRVVEGLGDTPKIASYKAHDRRVRGLAWSPQGDRLASVGGDGLLKLWDPIRGMEKIRMKVSGGWVMGVAWSSDGKRLATAGADFLVIAWDAETGRKLSTMRGHNDFADAVAWSPDGTRLASAGIDNSVRLWDPHTGEETFVLRGKAGMFHDVAWSHDGAKLAAASSDGQVWIWDASRGFERDTTTRALPYIDRKVASGTARGEDLRWYAESWIRAGKFKGDLVLLKDDPNRPGSIRPSPQIVSRLNAGVAAFRQGRLADAVMSLQEVCDRLQVLRSVLPDHPELARLHGISLGFLARSLRDSGHQAEALGRSRESLAVFESLLDPNPDDLYNMARDCAMVSAMDGRGSPGDREIFEARAVEYLRRANAGYIPQFLTRVATDRDLDPLRSRADFRGMTADAAFPLDPFQEPSLITFVESLPAEERRKLNGLSEAIRLGPADFQVWRARGDFFARRGAWALALADFRNAIELRPPGSWGNSHPDTIFALDAAVVLIRSGDLEGYRRLARAMLDRFADTVVADFAERTAKVNLLIPPPEAELIRLEGLARRSVDLSQGSPYLGWYQLTRGLSRYRSGEFATAVEWLDKAATSDFGPEYRSTWKSYLAMAKFRLGRVEEARALLLEAGDLIAPRAAQRDVGENWHNHRIAEIAHREAEALINPASQAAGPAKH